MKYLSYVLLLFLIINSFVYSQKKTKKDIIVESQIPQSQLLAISTDELLEKCLDYPYMADVMFAQNIPLIFQYIRQEFNGFKELLGRQDAAQVILNRFINFDFNKINEYQADYEKGLYVFKFCYLNLLMAQDEIINGVGDNYKIINLINKKYFETNKENLIPFRDIVTITFVGYNMLRYFDNTELGNSSELSSLISSAQSLHIGSLDYTAFNNLSDYVSKKIEGK